MEKTTENQNNQSQSRAVAENRTQCKEGSGGTVQFLDNRTDSVSQGLFDANAVQHKDGGSGLLSFVDNRSEAAAQRKMIDMMGNSPQAKQAVQMKARMQNCPHHASTNRMVDMIRTAQRAKSTSSPLQGEEVGRGGFALQKEAIDDEEPSPMKAEPAHTKENKTGMPDNLKNGLENLTGLSMAHVNVHNNSPESAQLNAHAFTQGRVKPTMQMADETPLSVSSKFASHLSAAPIQRVLAVKEDMLANLKEAIKQLNSIEKFLPSPTAEVNAFVREQLMILEASDYATDEYDVKIRKFVASIKTKLPAKEVAVEHEPVAEPVELAERERNIHSIWVQGDYAEQREVVEGIGTREGTHATEWQNLIWVYKKSEAVDARLFTKVGGVIARPVQLGHLGMSEVDFRATILAWDERPDWVNVFIEILDILIGKKGFVAMSDIMRMIILYYQGGLYQDVKIKLKTPSVEFFDKPLVNVGKLQLVVAGQLENWALVAHAGCRMIEDIMIRTIDQFPPLDVLRRLPENYARGGEYSGMHADLHEEKGPWNVIERLKGKVDRISTVNPNLHLENPRPANSWERNDRTSLERFDKLPVLASKKVTAGKGTWEVAAAYSDLRGMHGPPPPGCVVVEMTNARDGVYAIGHLDPAVNPQRTVFDIHTEMVEILMRRKGINFADANVAIANNTQTRVIGTDDLRRMVDIIDDAARRVFRGRVTRRII